MYCLETHNLSHRFSVNDVVLNNISLQVPTGSIYGFLGPNGAGKTTTLKLVLGLLRKQEGDISIFGKPFENNRVASLRKIGSLIESPSLYGHLTAEENLLVYNKIYQCPENRISQVLELVGIANTGRKKASQFSLGMKQRLAIAIALLHEPSLLVLDEPTNGLDPNGIIEMRELLKKLNQENGITIVISSHLLAEIEKLVTHIGIISKGEMIFQGTLDDLITRQRQSLSIVFDTSDADLTFRILKDNGIRAFFRNGKVEISPVVREKVASINRSLVEAEIEVYEITTSKNDLEMIFMDLINK